MGDWSTYSLSDFLMFSPRTYWRMIELYQRAVWPGQLLALGAGLGCLVIALRPTPRSRRVAWVLLSVSWLWVGWAFHAQRYATINWAASYFAVAFALQAMLLGALAWHCTAQNPPPRGTASTIPATVGWLLAAVAVLLFPLVGLAVGRPLVQSDLFGMTPEPTALATLGLLPALGRGLPAHWLWAAAGVPALSLAIGTATLWTMGQ